MPPQPANMQVIDHDDIVDLILKFLESGELEFNITSNHIKAVSCHLGKQIRLKIYRHKFATTTIRQALGGREKIVSSYKSNN